VVFVAQPAGEVAVIIKIVLCTVVPPFVRVPDMGVPDPLVAISPPTGGRLPSLVHENVVPGTLFASVRLIGVIEASVQLVCVDGEALASVAGLTIKSVPLSVPFIAGLLLTTRIL
jgi:hypothetical protein